jgi:hypothetical protein
MGGQGAPLSQKPLLVLKNSEEVPLIGIEKDTQIKYHPLFLQKNSSLYLYYITMFMIDNTSSNQHLNKKIRREDTTKAASKGTCKPQFQKHRLARNCPR